MQEFMLSTSFFDDEKVKALRSVKDGNTIVLLYLMLTAGVIKNKTDGQLRLCDTIPYNETIIASLYNLPIQAVKQSLEALVHFGLITHENGVYSIKNYEQFVSRNEKKHVQNNARQKRFQAKQSTVLSG